MKKCKWCGKLITKEHTEENCDSNDGGREDMNYEDIANKYF